LGAEKLLKRNFQKVLDDDAKADQNLASLLMTTNQQRKQRTQVLSDANVL